MPHIPVHQLVAALLQELEEVAPVEGVIACEEDFEGDSRLIGRQSRKNGRLPGQDLVALELEGRVARGLLDAHCKKPVRLPARLNFGRAHSEMLRDLLAESMGPTRARRSG